MGAGRSQQRSRDSTQSCSHCASGPTRRCWAPAASAPRSPQRCWSPPGTTPSGCAAKRRSPRSAGPAPSRRHQGPGSATGSTAAATAEPTTRCGASPPWGCVSIRLRRAPPSRGQDPTRDHPLPQAPHRTRDIRLLTDPPQVPHGESLRLQRTRRGLTIDAAAQAPHPHTTRISALERGLYHNRDLAERHQRHLTQLAS